MNFIKVLKKYLLMLKITHIVLLILQWYKHIGDWECIVEKQNGDKRSEYGKGLIKELSIQMTKDFGKGYTERNL